MDNFESMIELLSIQSQFRSIIAVDESELSRPYAN